MNNNILKICKNCNEQKTEDLFKKGRRLCKACIYKINDEKNHDYIKNYYAIHQDEITSRRNEIYKQKMIKKYGSVEKIQRGRPRTINIKKQVDETITKTD